MKTLLVVVFVVLSAASAAAQGGIVGVYVDAFGTDCTIEDTLPGVMIVWIVHSDPGGAVGIEFRATVPACWTGASWIGDLTGDCVNIDPQNSQVGMGCPYPSCTTDPITVVGIQIFTAATGPACCAYPVEPSLLSVVDPNNINVEKCDGSNAAATGQFAVVNANSTCPCGATVSTQHATWGAIKSAYLE